MTAVPFTPLCGCGKQTTWIICVLLIASSAMRVLAQAHPEEQLTVRATYDDDRIAPANLRVELLASTETVSGSGQPMVLAR